MLYLVKTQAFYWSEDGSSTIKVVDRYEIKNKLPEDGFYTFGIVIFKHKNQERIKKYAALRNLDLECIT